MFLLNPPHFTLVCGDLAFFCVRSICSNSDTANKYDFDYATTLYAPIFQYPLKMDLLFILNR